MVVAIIFLVLFLAMIYGFVRLWLYLTCPRVQAGYACRGDVTALWIDHSNCSGGQR